LGDSLRLAKVVPNDASKGERQRVQPAGRFCLALLNVYFAVWSLKRTSKPGCIVRILG
jgi:hypothetical protein